MSSRVSAWWGGIALAAASVALAAAPDLPALLAGELAPVRRWGEVAPAVRQELEARWKGGGIADAGVPFQSTDVVSPGQALPIRRLVLGLRSGRTWLVCYERGGVAHSFHLVVVPLDGQRVRSVEVWAATLSGPVEDLPALRDLVRRRGYRESEIY